MINRLLIKNYAIIEELEISFSDRLTIITGETGAGKSILLGALGLIMGKRADTKALYDEEKKCVVEAYFDISKYGLKTFFQENDIDFDEQVVVRRELTPSGKSRAFVNDTPVNLNILQQLSGALVDLHQQFDNLDINNISFQLRMIDALAENNSLLNEYQKLFKIYQSNKSRLRDLEEQNENAAKEIDFLNFQLDEFDEAGLVQGEQEQLEDEIKRLTNAEDIKSALSAAFQHISEGEQPVIGQLEEISASLSSVQKFHPELAKNYERLESLILELQDISREFEKMGEETEYDPDRIAEIQARLDTIYKLLQKHNVATVNELLEIQNNLQTQLNAFGDVSDEIETLKKVIGQQKETLKGLASKLSEKRKSVVAGFEKKVHHLLSQLSMEHSQLKVEISPLPEMNSTGIDEVVFLFAPNKGSRFLPIRDVASGGELSRLTLCTKSLVASAIPLPTLIFDEIDTGISGDVALKMGNILQELSNRHQVISITHTPQIAVKADTHYFVYKKVMDDRTVTKVKKLTFDERVRAVATMLSGSPPSASAIENAKELLKL